MKTETLAATAIEVKPKRRRSFYREYEALILGGSAVLIVLAAWETIWQYGRGYRLDSEPMISALFFTGPSAVWQAFLNTWRAASYSRICSTAAAISRSDSAAPFLQAWFWESSSAGIGPSGCCSIRS